MPPDWYQLDTCHATVSATLGAHMGHVALAQQRDTRDLEVPFEKTHALPGARRPASGRERIASP